MILDILYLIITPLFFIWTIRNVFFWVQLWQLKEYRLDRIRIHLSETRQGKNLINNTHNKLKIAFLLSYFITIFYNGFLGVYSILVSVIIFTSFLKVLDEVINKKGKIPIFTIKTILISLIAIFFAFSFYLFPLLNKFFWLLLIDKIIPFIVALLFGIFSIPSDVYKDIIIYKAIKKRIHFSNLSVIGITGSYGKGSTKEFLSKILSNKYSVLKSHGTHNTDIGLAKTILDELNDRKEIFIAEIGGYKIGEILKISYIVKPNIGILTAVNDQHASLFGGIENTMKAKFELIESLPRDGIALFNGNNSYSLKMAKKTKKRNIVYYADYENKKDLRYAVNAFNIRVRKFFLLFDVYFKDTNEYMFSLKVKVLGKHNVENILPGIYLARHFGMSEKEIKDAMLKILPVKKTMEPYINTKGTVLIDDTYNANPDAVKAALEYSKIYKGKKVLVIQPMIELGKNAEMHHYNLGKTAGNVCNYLISTNNNFYDAIEKGIHNSSGNCLHSIMPPKKILEFINSKLSKDDIVIFEGKEADIALSILEYEKIY